MNQLPIEERITKALKEMGRESPRTSPEFSDQLFKRLDEVLAKESKVMARKRGILVWIAGAIATLAALWWLGMLSASEPPSPVTPFSGRITYNDSRITNSVNAVLLYLEGSFGAIAMLVAALLAMSFLIARRYKSAATFLTASIACFVLRSTMSTFFNDRGISDGESVVFAPIAPRIEAEYGIPAVLPREQYGQYAENERMTASTHPVSTFSADVDTGSYTNMRRFVTQGQLPPPESVRIEEYVNYFRFGCTERGDSLFNICHDTSPSPFEPGRHILRMTVKASEAAIPENLGWNLVFLVDVSGSMNEPMKLPLVKRSLALVAQRMRPIDRLAIVTYAGSSQVLLPSTPGEERGTILSAIDSLGAGGATYGSGGIESAYRVAQNGYIPGSVNRVILATDGDFNVGVTSTQELVSLIERKRQGGITLTTLGFGQGNIREDVMEQLADKGNGNYFYIDSYQEARRVLDDGLTSNMKVVASDVKMQVEFNPQRVESYRLIGFDNRRLSERDFNDDTKDAGEVGAGHSVTAVYEITLRGSNVGTVSAPLRRYATPTVVAPAPQVVAAEPSDIDTEIAHLRIRYKKAYNGESTLIERPILQNVNGETASVHSDHFFAVAVAELGEYLRQGKYSDSIDLNKIIELANAGLGADADGRRREFIELTEAIKRLRRDEQ